MGKFIKTQSYFVFVICVLITVCFECLYAFLLINKLFCIYFGVKIKHSDVGFALLFGSRAETFNDQFAELTKQFFFMIMPYENFT